MDTTLHDPDLRRPPQPAVPCASRHRPGPAVPMLWIEGDPRVSEVLQAYERGEGLWTGDDATLMLRRRTAQPVSLLARWIVDSLVVSYAWRGDYLLPVFQFDLAAATVRRPVLDALEALDGTLKDLDLAAWFALPNDLLEGGAPMDVIARDPLAVLAAAHAECLATRR